MYSLETQVWRAIDSLRLGGEVQSPTCAYKADLDIYGERNNRITSQASLDSLGSSAGAQPNAAHCEGVLMDGWILRKHFWRAKTAELEEEKDQKSTFRSLEYSGKHKTKLQTLESTTPAAQVSLPEGGRGRDISLFCQETHSTVARRPSTTSPDPLPASTIELSHARTHFKIHSATQQQQQQSVWKEQQHQRREATFHRPSAPPSVAHYPIGHVNSTSVNALTVSTTSISNNQHTRTPHDQQQPISMEMILAPMDHEQFGKDALWQHEPVRRLPSLFRHAEAVATESVARSPRLVGMSDVLNASRPLKDALRLPSIGSMIRREDSSPRVETTPTTTTTTTTTTSTQEANSMSPAQKQCMDLYKQLREVPSSPLDARSHPEYALGNLLAGAALSQLASMQEKREAAAAAAENQFRVREKMRSILPALNTSVASDSADKSKRTSSAKLCGMSECRKRAKAGGYCIAHGGGLRCSEEECQKHAVSLGLCISHGGGKRCTIEGCLNASRKNGVCWSHGGKRLCKLDGCNKGPKSGGYCWSHGGKMKK